MGTFITAVTILNMLIALMGDTHGDLSAIKAQSALEQKMSIVSDHVFLVGNNPDLKKRYIYVFKPKTDVSEDASLSEIKQELESNMAEA